MKLSREGFDNAILKAANSVEEHLKKSEDASTASQEQNTTDKGADCLFCPSLIPRFKRLPEISRAVLRVKIERVFLKLSCKCLAAHSSLKFNFPKLPTY